MNIDEVVRKNAEFTDGVYIIKNPIDVFRDFPKIVAWLKASPVNKSIYSEELTALTNKLEEVQEAK